MKPQMHAPTWKNEEAMDHHQNDQNVKAVSPRHYVATSVLSNCCFNCCVEQSRKDNVHSTAVE